MTKPKTRPKAATRSTARKAAKPAPRKHRAAASPGPAAKSNTKHARIIAILRSPAGATIAALVTVTKNGSSIRCAAFSPEWSAKSSGSTWFLSKRTRDVFIASRMVTLRPSLRPGLSGPALLSGIVTGEVDCFVIDYKMPAMSGIDLASRLRNRDIDAPIILITGYPDKHILDKAAASGIRHVLLKPHLEDSLASRIRGAIEESHPG